MARRGSSLGLTLFCMISIVPVAGASRLSNGLRPILRQEYTLALFSKGPVASDVEGAFERIDRRVLTLARKASRLGIAFDAPVHIRVAMDSGFPCRDLWTAAGVQPQPEALNRLVRTLEVAHGATTLVELARAEERLRLDWYFLTRLPVPMALDEAALKKPSTDWLRWELQTVQNHPRRLIAALDSPVAQARRFYYCNGANGYLPFRRSIWLTRPPNEPLDRTGDRVVHFVGHHVFALLTDQVLRGLPQDTAYSVTTRACVSEALRNVRDFFADCFAGPLGPEASPRAGNGLAPTRALFRRLQEALGVATADRLLVEATRRGIAHFFRVEVPRHEHVEDRIMGQGAFRLKGFATDPDTENRRMVKHFKEAARALLAQDSRRAFNKAGGDVFGPSFDH